MRKSDSHVVLLSKVLLIIACDFADAFISSKAVTSPSSPFFSSFGTAQPSASSLRLPLLSRLRSTSDVSSPSSPNSTVASSPPPTLSLNGQRILPTKVLLGGLAAHSEPISSVYAVLNKSFRRGTDGWESVEHVGSTSHLAETIQRHSQECNDPNRIAHVRALSFTFPEPNAMRTVARMWREQALAAGAPLDQVPWSGNAVEYLLDDDDDDEDDDDDGGDDWRANLATDGEPARVVEEEAPLSIISPFAETPAAEDGSTPTTTDGRLPLTAENIDKVLEEVRPYLIADGGNVAVSRIDPGQKTVYLRLVGACGSCPSSTVTMKMGIERVLKEHFDVDQILQEDGPDNPTELTWEAVEVEVNRIRPAIMAMGGVCDLVSVDAATGLVTIKFRGFNKVQQGLELAIRGLPFVNAVQFVTGTEE
jgi:NFU1 iron-sulfur cluster scaffold homolog, mitochondrial